jgi:hypothetical protein
VPAAKITMFMASAIRQVWSRRFYHAGHNE